MLFPANFLKLMTVHAVGISTSTHLGSGLVTAWRQDWPLVSIILGLQGIILPFFRFGLLSVTLGALRFGARGDWLGPAFRLSEHLDMWAMADVLFLGFGVGYGRVAAETDVTIDAGGWCFVAAAMMTMVTRESLDRGAIWRLIAPPTEHAGPNPVACVECDLVLPAAEERERCPRCAARLDRRKPGSLPLCMALVLASWILIPLAYALPLSEFWEIGSVSPHSIPDGIGLLWQNGFYSFAVLISVVSVGIPFTKLIGLSWFLWSVHKGSSARLRWKTRLYRFIDASGRWSNLDPFTVLIFAPMVQLGQVAHIEFRDGSAAFLGMVILSMLAARVFDPRLIWDGASAGAALAYPDGEAAASR